MLKGCLPEFCIGRQLRANSFEFRTYYWIVSKLIYELSDIVTFMLKQSNSNFSGKKKHFSAILKCVNWSGCHKQKPKLSFQFQKYLMKIINPMLYYLFKIFFIKTNSPLWKGSNAPRTSALPSKFCSTFL